MQLQTQIPLKPQKNQIEYTSKVLLLGSCFSENIGERFQYYQFNVAVNPFGVIFQPLAIEKLISQSLGNGFFSEKDVFFHNGLWQCFDAHSTLSGTTSEATIKDLNAALLLLRESLLNASHIIITLGTAWVYRFLENGLPVANCHKLPQKFFLKELLSTEQIKTSLGNIWASIRQHNPNATIVFTISPVRHLKDGFIENQLSKSHLITALHATLNKPSTDTPLSEAPAYFPAYEIMMDELRDYRFYAEDMLHPNTLAINYIWEKFKQVFLAPTTHALMDEVANIQNGLAHRPFNPDSEEYKHFRETLQQKIVTIKTKLPHAKFS